MGLAMQLAPQEWPHWLGQEPPNPCPQYHRPRRSGQPVCWSYWQIAPGNWVNQWREACVDEPLLKHFQACLLYTSPSPRDQRGSRMPSSA